MKHLPVILGLVALFVSVALLIQQQCDAQAPSVLLIQDMSSSPAHPRTAPPAGSIPYGEQTPAKHSAAIIFTNHCSTCHGNSGNGKSYVATYPGMPSVGDLTTTNKTSEELKESIRNGRGAMPIFQHRLNESEIELLTDYIINQLRNK